jgi:hypothetical protein
MGSSDGGGGAVGDGGGAEGGGGEPRALLRHQRLQPPDAAQRREHGRVQLAQRGARQRAEGAVRGEQMEHEDVLGPLDLPLDDGVVEGEVRQPVQPQQRPALRHNRHREVERAEEPREWHAGPVDEHEADDAHRRADALRELDGRPGGLRGGVAQRDGV